ncbi:hypothetical protein SAY86_028617 [Trapa natans]|uniref:C2 domain-containing protein n=1 Tax=Trapa natans TaxID=22666 RepID=A0AAN7REC2_TRANT|nr:hypothetical protein SAY86_028617 [Trapa natans]
MSDVLRNPFQLLELNIHSAQDLETAGRSMRTYAVAWIHPDRKLSTRVDPDGHNNPTWNDKFVFRVDDEFLESDSSAIMAEIYAVHWFKDVLVGTVRILVDNVLPALPSNRPFRHRRCIGMEFAVLQVRRPSGRPQGLLNIGMAVHDSTMRSMPLYSQISSSGIGFKHLLDQPDSIHHKGTTDRNPNPDPNQPKKQQKQETGAENLELRRTKSDSSSMVGSNESRAVKKKVSFKQKASSLGGGSVIESSTHVKKKGEILESPRASSTLTTSSLKPGSQVGLRAKRLDDEVGALSFRRKGHGRRPRRNSAAAAKNNSRNNSSGRRGARRKLRSDIGITDSELGPSPSEVAADIAAKKKNKAAADDVESSVLGGAAWSVADSVEGLQSKLERWRAEIPAAQDAGSDILPSVAPSVKMEDSRGGGAGRRHRGRRKKGNRGGRGDREGGEGLFSCFSNICGCECSITCRNPFKKRHGPEPGRRRSRSPAGSSMYT